MGSVTPTKLLLFIWAIPIVVMLQGVILEPGGNYVISRLTVSICLAGILSVLVGIFAGRMIPLASSTIVAPPSRRAAYLTLGLVAICGITGGFLAIRAWRNLGIDVFSPNSVLLYSMNVLYAEEGGLLSGIAGRLYALLPIQLFLAVYLWRTGSISGRVGLLVAGVALVLMISPRRSMFITSALAATIFFWQGKRIAPIKLATFGLAAALLFLAFFGVTQSYLGKVDTGGLQSTIRSAIYYYSSSPVVMDALVRTHHFEGTWIIGNSVARASNALFDTRYAVDLSVPFVPTPDPANTVPAFYYFYKSGGLLGVIVSSFIIGVSSTLSLRLYIRTQTFLSGTIAALCMVGLLLTIRECIFIGYDFLYWVVVSAVLSRLLRFRLVPR